MQRTLRIGTRKSVLALAQADIVRSALMAAFPGLAAETVPMVTSGDISTAPSLADIGGKALFTKELEEALLAESIDIAVHSLKDMETSLPRGLIIGAFIERGDPRDALIAPGGKTLGLLRKGARVGTSSPRRFALLKILRPDLEVVPFRGNVTTRLAKIAGGEVEASVLALAGLARIGKQSEATEILDATRFLPAVGQGTLAVECRERDDDIREMLAAINHTNTERVSVAERSLLAALGGSCRTPIAGYAAHENGVLHLHSLIAAPDGSAHLTAARHGSPEDAALLGEDAGKELLARGGNAWIA